LPPFGVATHSIAKNPDDMVRALDNAGDYLRLRIRSLPGSRTGPECRPRVTSEWGYLFGLFEVPGRLLGYGDPEPGGLGRASPDSGVLITSGPVSAVSGDQDGTKLALLSFEKSQSQKSILNRPPVLGIAVGTLLLEKSDWKWPDCLAARFLLNRLGRFQQLHPPGHGHCFQLRVRVQLRQNGFHISTTGADRDIQPLGRSLDVATFGQ